MNQPQTKTVAVALVYVLLSSCNGGVPVSPLVKALDGVQIAADAAGIAAPLLLANNEISASDATVMETAASETSTAVPEAITEAQSTDTNPVKLQKITADFQPVLNTVLTNVSPKAAAYVIAVQALINDILMQLNAPAVAKLAAKNPNGQLVFTRGDKAMFAKTNAQAKTTQANAQDWLTTHPKK